MARRVKKKSRGKNETNKANDFDSKAKLIDLIENRKNQRIDKLLNKTQISSKSANEKPKNKNSEKLIEDYKSLFEKFAVPQSKETNHNTLQLELIERKIYEPLEESSMLIEEDSNKNEQSLSKRKLRKISKPTLAQLKSSVPYAQTIEWFDCDAPDPHLLASIKSSKNLVPVPSHWQMKREYLSGRSLLGKKPFELPEPIRDTGIEVMRHTLPTSEDADDLSLKEASRARVQPKMGSLDIDYKKLHDVFFKIGVHWKPQTLLTFGDMYYENRNLQSEEQWRFLRREKQPGKISNELREALNLQEGQLPPWCMKMKHLGTPPGYLNFLIAGVNWDITNLKGDTYGILMDNRNTENNEISNEPLFGTLISVDESDREEDEDEFDEQVKNEHTIIEELEENIEETKVVPLNTKSNSKVDNVKEAGAEDESSKKLYTVLKERTSGETSTYELPGTKHESLQLSDDEHGRNNLESEDQLHSKNFKF